MKKVLSIALLMVICSLQAFAGPYIDASPSVLNSFNYSFGIGPSESKVVVIESTILAPSSGNIAVTCPGDYEVSLDNITFAGTASIPYSNDMLPATNVYIRLKAGLPLGNYNLETVSFNCPSASKTVSASGSVTSLCTVTPGTIGASSATFSWNATGALAYECKVDQLAGSPTTSGATSSATTFTQNGLSPQSSYFFHVRGNVGNNNFTTWTNVPFSTASTGIVTTKGNDYNVTLMPNPSNGSFTINGTSDDVLTIDVVSAIGQTIYSTVISPAKGLFSKAVALPLSVPSGIYIVNVSGEKGSAATRISVAR